MASLERRPRSNIYHVIFRFAGKRYKRSLNTTVLKKAISLQARLEDTIDLVDKGHLQIPNGADIGTFLLSEGKRTGIQSNSGFNDSPTPPPRLTLKQAFDSFFDSIPSGNLEEGTVKCMHIHERHMLRLLKQHFHLHELSLQDLQMYVNKRAAEKSQFGTNVTATTIKKELATLGTVWRWAVHAKRLKGEFPRNGLRLPKTEEAPPFQTWDEIERQLQTGDLNDKESNLLWNALYLRRNEIDALLASVKQQAAHPFIEPMFVLAAHTGARRSELLRSQRTDFDFHNDIVTIRERKRVRNRETTRRVPLSPLAKTTMQVWLEGQHPGGSYAFCHVTSPCRSRTRPSSGTPITKDQAHCHFQRTLKGTRWNKIRGWHCLRHSFISNLASSGVDQRIIDEFVGHTTEEMRRRYRHLFPDVKHAAIDKVFG